MNDEDTSRKPQSLQKKCWCGRVYYGERCKEGHEPFVTAPTPMNETNEHNPDGLTPEQYGAPEWRLLKFGELITEGDELKAIGEEWVIAEGGYRIGAGEDITFRRRVSPPADQSARIAELERELKIERGEVEAGDRVLKDQDEEIAQLRAEVERLKIQLAEREEDRALLDWLIDFVQQNGADGIRNMIWTMDPDEDDIERADLLFDRAAIRAARAQEAGK